MAFPYGRYLYGRGSYSAGVQQGTLLLASASSATRDGGSQIDAGVLALDSISTAGRLGGLKVDAGALVLASTGGAQRIARVVLAARRSLAAQSGGVRHARLNSPASHRPLTATSSAAREGRLVKYAVLALASTSSTGRAGKIKPGTATRNIDGESYSTMRATFGGHFTRDVMAATSRMTRQGRILWETSDTEVGLWLDSVDPLGAWTDSVAPVGPWQDR